MCVREIDMRPVAINRHEISTQIATSPKGFALYIVDNHVRLKVSSPKYQKHSFKSQY